jgi:hypothetical protein
MLQGEMRITSLPGWDSEGGQKNRESRPLLARLKGKMACGDKNNLIAFALTL